MTKSAPPPPAATTPTTPEPALLRDEYVDASNNARQFNTLRFAELTIFMTATGALVTLVFSRVAAPRRSRRRSPSRCLGSSSRSCSGSSTSGR